MLAILMAGSSKVPPLCELLYNPVGSRETCGQVLDAMPVGAALATPNAFSSFCAGYSVRRGESRKRPSLLSNSGCLYPLAPRLRLLLVGRATPAIRPGRWMGSRMRRQLQETSSWWPRCPPPAPSPPPGWVLPGRRSHRGSRRPAPGTGCERSRVASTGAGCLLEGAQGSGGAVSITVRIFLEPKFSSLLTLQKASSGAESPFSAPRSSRAQFSDFGAISLGTSVQGSP